MVTPKEFIDELSNAYRLSIDPQDVEYLLDLPSGTLAVRKIIQFKNIHLRENSDGDKQN